MQAKQKPQPNSLRGLTGGAFELSQGFCILASWVILLSSSQSAPPVRLGLTGTYSVSRHTAIDIGVI